MGCLSIVVIYCWLFVVCHCLVCVIVAAAVHRCLMPVVVYCLVFVVAVVVCRALLDVVCCVSSGVCCLSLLCVGCCMLFVA